MSKRLQSKLDLMTVVYDTQPMSQPGSRVNSDPGAPVCQLSFCSNKMSKQEARARLSLWWTCLLSLPAMLLSI
eukprot:188528-Pelagomonas_calceolata.AAC.5